MKIANILFRTLQVFLSIVALFIFGSAILFVYKDSAHFYDHLFDDQKKISYISECYRNNMPIDTSFTDYKIDSFKDKITFSSKTCKITYSIDNNGTIQDSQEYTLIKKPHILYAISYIILISLWIWTNNMIYSEDTSQSDKITAKI